jgi:hypothetical protein
MPGDILYIPSYWFHYIISQDTSIQCNGRSGNTEIGREHITACGFYENEEEEEPEKKMRARPDKRAKPRPDKQHMRPPRERNSRGP